MNFRGVKIGDKAPDFIGCNQGGKLIKMSDYHGSKIILFFYPKDMTPGCTLEVQNLRDNYGALKGMGYIVLGVSADSTDRHKRFIEKHNLPFELMSDEDRVIISSYGVWGPRSLWEKSMMVFIGPLFLLMRLVILNQ